MKKYYRVTVKVDTTYDIKADTEEEAIDKAYDYMVEGYIPEFETEEIDEKEYYGGWWYMEEIVKDLKEIREWYETFLDESISTEMMDSNEIDEYQTLSNKFQDIIDKLSNMWYYNHRKRGRKMNEEMIRADEREKVVNEILKAIESEYDLNYGEILINPRDFWDLVEGYR